MSRARGTKEIPSTITEFESIFIKSSFFKLQVTDEGTITERFRRVDYGSMEIDVTIDDPKAYTEPFTVRVNHRVMLDTDLIEFICLENEKSSEHFDR